MADVVVTYYTDPACPWSWAAEPAVRRVEAEFGDQVAFTYVMGGVAREFSKPEETALHALDAAAASAMPVDARLWLERPPRSSYPACQAVKAAAEQRLDGPYLRRVREAMMVDRRPSDTIEGLIDVARRVPGLDVARFELALKSNATLEAFGADLDRVRAEDDPRVSFPTFDVGDRRIDTEDAQALRDGVAAAGAESQPLPDPAGALRRFGRIAAAEVAAVCDLPLVRVEAELWRLATELRARPERVGTGVMWSPA